MEGPDAKKARTIHGALVMKDDVSKSCNINWPLRSLLFAVTSFVGPKIVKNVDGRTEEVQLWSSCFCQKEKFRKL